MKHGKRNTDVDSIDEGGWIIDDNTDLMQTVTFSGNQKMEYHDLTDQPAPSDAIVWKSLD